MPASRLSSHSGIPGFRHFLAMFRKIIVLIPLIYILPVFLEDDVMAVFLAEPIADVIAVLTTVTLFFLNFRKLLREMREQGEKNSDLTD